MAGEVHLCRHDFVKGECPVGGASCNPQMRSSRRYVRASGEQVPITEDGPRSWEPEEKATDRQMNMVFEILMENPDGISQAEVGQLLAERLGLETGTARGATSASLLWIRRAGWIADSREKEGRSVVWKIIA